MITRPIVTQCVQTNHRHHYGVDVSYWSTLGYYHVMEGVKQRYPNLVLEGCSGGGHIKDFGYIKRVHYIVTTDTLSALPDRQSIYDSTFAFPPAVLMAYTYENFYNKDADRPRAFLLALRDDERLADRPYPHCQLVARGNRWRPARGGNLQVLDSAHAQGR